VCEGQLLFQHVNSIVLVHTMWSQWNHIYSVQRSLNCCKVTGWVSCIHQAWSMDKWPTIHLCTVLSDQCPNKSALHPRNNFMRNPASNIAILIEGLTNVQKMYIIIMTPNVW